MPTTDVNGRSSESEAKFAVGWQRLTREEFLEAISAALLEKVQMRESEHGEEARHFSRTAGKSAG